MSKHDFSARVGTNVFHAVWSKQDKRYTVILQDTVIDMEQTMELAIKARIVCYDADDALCVGHEWILNNHIVSREDNAKTPQR